MAPPDPPFDEGAADWGGEEDPLGAWPLLGDLTRLLRSPDVSRQAADQLALAVASDGGTEANVSPADRADFSDLAGIAQRAAEAATGLPITADHGPVEVAVVNRGGWAHHTLRDWRPHFQQLQEALTAARDSAETHEPSAETPEAMLRHLMGPLAPLLADMTAGSLTGRLARAALGSHDLALPRLRSDRLLLVEPNIAAFAEAWSLPRDDTCLWVCVHSLVCNAVLSVPSVHRRLTDLLKSHARSFRIDPGGIVDSLQERLGDLDPERAMAEMPALLSSPEILLGATASEDQEAVAGQLEDLLSVLAGYVDATTELACSQLLGSQSPVREAFRRRRLSPPAEARQLARLLGVDVAPEATGRGARFVEGVTERAGAEGIGRLWQSADNWPTPNEIDAPGLWLARLEVYEGPGDSGPGVGGRPNPGG
ncbi:MAG: zinc-dependent metalloprotease [bacterium]|nr:zinc-dependent metalloprotease [bacterium]